MFCIECVSSYNHCIKVSLEKVILKQLLPIKTGNDSKLVYITLFRPMEFSIKPHTIKLGWSIVHNDESGIIITKKYCIFMG